MDQKKILSGRRKSGPFNKKKPYHIINIKDTQTFEEILIYYYLLKLYNKSVA